jgi:hypothetical protein
MCTMISKKNVTHGLLVVVVLLTDPSADVALVVIVSDITCTDDD